MSARGNLHMGQNTHKVPLKLFADNRQKLCDSLKKLGDQLPERSHVFLQGGDDLSFYDTDVNYNFRQESYFMWCFGVLEPGFYGCIDVKTGRSILFIPRLPAEYEVWMGKLMCPDDCKQKYEVDEAYYVDEMVTVLGCREPVLLLMKGTNSDSRLEHAGANFDGIANFKTNDTVLYNVIAECRVTKSELELDTLRYVTKISSDAHIEVMKKMAPGMSEYQAEAIFLEHCYREGGCRHISYTCICGCGTNSAILHYGHAAAPNDRISLDGDMCLFDMGANYFGHAADITCSFPVNGKFTEDQKTIYNIVLEANTAVHKNAKAGVAWTEMHKLSLTVILEGLKNAGILQGSVEEMMEANLGAVFMPHGLGHLIGLDVHDVGGYLPGYPARPALPGFKSLRTARVLEKNMCVTIEPGCYFIKPLIENAKNDPKQSKFLVLDRLDQFMNFGGVRIEDDVIITEDGVENMTKVPRTVEEIESVMAKKTTCRKTCKK